MTISNATELQFPDALLESYEPLETLGEGASGLVMLARDRTLDRKVAVKLLRRFSSPEAEERFRREAEVLSRFKHPNLLHLYSFGVEDGMPYLVTDLVDGANLRKACQGGADPLGLLLQVAPGLDVVHREGVVHRDIKPENILVDPRRGAVLADFGLAYDPAAQPITATGSVVGTIAYMAPELLRGKPASPAADWFAWGATLYELREGRLPFAKVSVAGIMMGRPMPELVFQKIPAAGPEAEGLRRLLAEDPSTRPTSAREVADILAGRLPDSASGVRRRDKARSLSASDPAVTPRSKSGPMGKEKGAPRTSRRIPALLLVLFGVVPGYLAGRRLPGAATAEPPPPAPAAAAPPTEPGPARLNARQTIELWRGRARELDVAGRLAALVAPVPMDSWATYYRFAATHRLRNQAGPNAPSWRSRRAASASTASTEAVPPEVETRHWSGRTKRLDLVPALEAATRDLPFVETFRAESERLGGLLADPGQPLADRLELFHAVQAFGHIDAYWAAWDQPPPYQAARVLDRLAPVKYRDSVGLRPGLPVPVPGQDPGRGSSLLFRWVTKVDTKGPYLLPNDADIALGEYPGVPFALASDPPGAWKVEEHTGLSLRVWLGDREPRHGYTGAALEASLANHFPPNRLRFFWNELEVDAWADPAYSPSVDPRALSFPECDVTVGLPAALLRPGWNNLRVEIAALPGLRCLRGVEIDWVVLTLE